MTPPSGGNLFLGEIDELTDPVADEWKDGRQAHFLGWYIISRMS